MCSRSAIAITISGSILPEKAAQWYRWSLPNQKNRPDFEHQVRKGIEYLVSSRLSKLVKEKRVALVSKHPTRLYALTEGDQETMHTDDSDLPPEILGITGPANAAQRDADINVIAAMAEFGGGFVKQLAELCYLADYHHLQRLKAFPDHWERYTRIHASREQIEATKRRLGMP